MAKKKKSRRSKRSVALPLTIVSSLGYVAGNTYGDIKRNGLETGTAMFFGNFTGFRSAPNQPQWDASRLKYGLIPMLLGVGVHKVASKLGLNRALASSGIPWIRI